jgi:A118 family predicted phage portal protein
MKIVENMAWPPINSFNRWKMAEHSAWYSGDANILANYYNDLMCQNILGLPYTLNRDLFWARQIKNDCEVGLHVPIAGDIAGTSADLLFGEPPTIKIAEAHEEKASEAYKKSQETLDTMLEKGFYRKIIEAAEVCAAMGGAYIKVAWDSDISNYPIPVVEQVDTAIPVFKFGVLTQVIFWKVLKIDDSGHKVYRLLETYDNDGSITYKLYLGNSEKLGKEKQLNTLPEAAEYEDVYTKVDALLAVYIPNVLPNRYNRDSYLGRSDYAGNEGLMDSLDETYSSWMRDILLAQAKVIIPGSYLEKDSNTGFRYNVDKMIFAKLDIDPVADGNKITEIQFDIRAEAFEKTTLNLLERIISSAGYSPQSFGLNIEGRAESGTALNIRERKSFATRTRKESYWEPALKQIVKLMIAIYKLELKGDIEADVTITTQFSDSVTSDMSETSTALQQLSLAMAVSTETKVRLLHPDWSEDEIMGEVEKIIEENSIGAAPVPEMNFDNQQLE